MHKLLHILKKEQTIYNTVFHELIRQVSVDCADRGELLSKIRFELLLEDPVSSWILYWNYIYICFSENHKNTCLYSVDNKGPKCISILFYIGKVYYLRTSLSWFLLGCLTPSSFMMGSEMLCENVEKDRFWRQTSLVLNHHLGVWPW